MQLELTSQEAEVNFQAVRNLPLAIGDPRHNIAHSILVKIQQAATAERDKQRIEAKKKISLQPDGTVLKDGKPCAGCGEEKVSS